MKLNKNQTTLMGTTMKVELLAAEIQNLKKQFEKNKETASVEELLVLRAELINKKNELNALKSQLRGVEKSR